MALTPPSPSRCLASTGSCRYARPNSSVYPVYGLPGAKISQLQTAECTFEQSADHATPLRHAMPHVLHSLPGQVCLWTQHISRGQSLAAILQAAPHLSHSTSIKAMIIQSYAQTVDADGERDGSWSYQIKTLEYSTGSAWQAIRCFGPPCIPCSLYPTLMNARLVYLILALLFI